MFLLPTFRLERQSKPALLVSITAVRGETEVEIAILGFGGSPHWISVELARQLFSPDNMLARGLCEPVRCRV